MYFYGDWISDVTICGRYIIRGYIIAAHELRKHGLSLYNTLYLSLATAKNNKNSTLTCDMRMNALPTMR